MTVYDPHDGILCNAHSHEINGYVPYLTAFLNILEVAFGFG